MPSKLVGVHTDDLGVSLGVSVAPQESDTPQMVLTDTKIRNLKSRDKPYKVADFDGLHVLVKPNGSKLWRFKYCILGKEKLLAIGSYPAISLSDARNLRDKARREVARGNDPSQMKREKALVEREGIGQTFKKISQMYLSKIEKEGRAPATMVKTRCYLGMANAAFGRKPITEITSPVVLRCLRISVNGNGPACL